MANPTFNHNALPLSITVEMDLMHPNASLGAGMSMGTGDIAGHPVELVMYPKDQSLVLHFGDAEAPDASYRLDFAAMFVDVQQYIERKGGLINV